MTPPLILHYYQTASDQYPGLVRVVVATPEGHVRAEWYEERPVKIESKEVPA